MITWTRVVLAGAGVTLALALWIAQAQSDAQLSALGSEQQRRDTVSAMFVSNQLGRALSQLDRLRDDPRVEVLRADNVPTKQALEDVFTTLMRLDPAIIQARWIDASGLEQVRVDRTPRSVVALTDEQLQDKSDRDYYQAITGLSDSTLWLSTIDLNEENGQVERPFKPTFRVASPLNQDRGFLILNYNAQPLIEEVYRSAESREQVGMLDQQGQWIVTPGVGSPWGLQLDQGTDALGLPSGVIDRLGQTPDGAEVTTIGLLSWAPVDWSAVAPDVQGPQLSLIRLLPAEQVSQIRWRYFGLSIGLWFLFAVPIGYFAHRTWRAQVSEQLSTQRQLAQEQQAKALLELEAEKLSRSNRDLDAFAYAAAHDLRSPLRAIGQYTGILLEDLEEIDPESRSHLVRIQDLSSSLDRMLKGLLQYSRIGRSDSKSERVDLNPLVQSMAAIYVIDGFTWEAQLEHRIQAPAALVELIIRNLMMNAVKHHHREQGHIKLWTAQSGDWVTLYCQDDGPGIPIHNWEQVFSVFGKLAGGKLQEQDGLGLAMVRRAAESLGGEIRIHDSTAAGTTFAVDFPAAVS